MDALHDESPLLAAQRRGGARVVDGCVVDFGHADDERAAVLRTDTIADVGELGVITVSGADAAALLQGQLTADLRALPANQSRLSAWCNPQGRALALFRVLRHDDGFALLAPREIIEASIRRLRMFVLRARVTITDAGDAMRCIGIAGDGIAARATGHLTLPGQPEECASQGDVHVVRLPDPQPRWLLVGPPASLTALWSAFAPDCQPVASAAWSLRDILAGLPQVLAATRERFIPLTLNLDALGGIGFQKGCYTGQEIIARMKYRGQLKQRMHIGRVDDGAVIPAPGMRLAIAGADMSAGEIVQSGRHPEGGFALSAVVTTELLRQHPVHVDSSGGPVVRWLPLPYPLDPE